jgi:asparagine synthase (glutamine-hydrolysing)
LVDRFRAEGFNLGLIDTLNDICRQNNASVGAVLKMAARRHFKFDGPATAPPDTKFLSAAALDRSGPTADHPWLNIPKGALPGKAVHVAMLTTIHGTIDGLPRDHAPQILPLLSQPIVELCLGIPMWKWITGGRNRSVARAAFTNYLPKKLIERQSKGGPDSFAYTVMEQNKAVVRERLTTGRLAAEGLIDPSAIAEAMDARRLIAAKDHMRLSDLSECESWVRYWEAKA